LEFELPEASSDTVNFEIVSLLSMADDPHHPHALSLSHTRREQLHPGTFGWT
jgi:hypothetical protein